MIEKKIEKDQHSQIQQFLSEIYPFKNIDRSILNEIVSAMTFVSLGGGETLIKEGDTDTSLYILYYGRMRVTIKSDQQHIGKEISLGMNGSNSEEIVGEIAPGQIVGEISFLLQTPRTGTVRAQRDCILLKLDLESFTKLKDKNSKIVTEMAMTSLRRLITKNKIKQTSNVSTIAVAPAGDSNHYSFTNLFVKELNKISPTLLINKEFCDKNLGENVSQIGIDEEGHSKITAWLQSLEQQYEYIIYETDRQMTPWTQRCIRQADRLLFVAEDTVHPSPNSIELTLAAGSSAMMPHTNLIFIHPNERIVNTQKWLKNRKISGFHHLRLDSNKDWKKMIRFLTDSALGLVLNGGGARALAHLGVLKAIEELNITIDFIGGTSMGAMLGGLYAKHGLAGTMEFAEVLTQNRVKDYTFPFLSILKGRLATIAMKSCYGDTYIEDLWTKFFCVSTNLSQCKLHVHETGLLWKAIRASTSLPGIYPPICEESGQVLVDGGVINNMPVDIMRSLITGGKIIAVNSHVVLTSQVRKVCTDPWISGWKLLYENFRKKDNLKQESIYNVIATSLNLASDDYQKQMEKEADYLVQINTSEFDLLDFQAMKQIREIGYRASMEQLPKLFGNDL